MLVAPERLAGNDGDLKFLQKIVRQIARGEDGAAGAFPPEQFAHIGKRIKCATRHAAANAGHGVKPLDDHAPPPIELGDHLFRKGIPLTQGHHGSLLGNGAGVRRALALNIGHAVKRSFGPAA